MKPRHDRSFHRYHRLALTWPVVTLVVLGFVGCGPMPGEPIIVKVPAKYTDLAGYRVAVLATADPYILSRKPAAAENVMRAVAKDIKANVEGSLVVRPDELIAFKEDRPRWETALPSQLMQALNVDRLVLIDLAEYRTFEPGNRHVKRGQIEATVQVYEAQADDPDESVLNVPVLAQFPREGQSKIGNVSASDRTIELGALQAFSLRAAGVFYLHEIEIDRGG